MKREDFPIVFVAAINDAWRMSSTTPISACRICGRPLRGRQTRFCGRACKNRHVNYHHKSYISQRARAIEGKKRLVRIMGGSCSRCGYGRNLAALEFHHIDPGSKSFSLDARTLANRSWALIAREASKCQLVCSNCHAEIHNPSSFWNPAP
ncbi:MAG: HNH endonuclease [Steroidobacteraceae bacterium]|nr:HNH endonuclease [Steroidobacteraceae bacterium]